MSKACTVITVRCLRSKTHIANDDFTCASTVCWMYAKWKILQCSSRNCYANQTKGPWSVMCSSRSWPDVPGNGVGVVSLPDVGQYWTSGYLAWNDFFIFCSVTTIGQFKCHPGNCLSTQNASKIVLCIKKNPNKTSNLDVLFLTWPAFFYNSFKKNCFPPAQAFSGLEFFSFNQYKARIFSCSKRSKHVATSKILDTTITFSFLAPKGRY